MSDSITITKEQFAAWYWKESLHTDSKPFESLKAFVEKPKRQEFWIDPRVIERPGGDLSMDAYDFNFGSGEHVRVKEVLPGDVGPMTKEEARAWVIGAVRSAPSFVDGTSCIGDILKALGLT